MNTVLGGDYKQERAAAIRDAEDNLELAIGSNWGRSAAKTANHALLGVAQRNLQQRNESSL